MTPSDSRLSPSHPTARARALIEAGRTAEAVVEAQAAAARDPGDAEAQALVAEASAILMAGDPDLVVLELSAAMFPEDAARQLDLADAYLELNRPIDAERVLKALVEQEPDNPVALQSLGVTYLSVGMHDAAEHYSQRAIALDPLLTIAHQSLASVFEARGEVGMARLHLARAYAQQSLFPQLAHNPDLTVLVLVTTESGNIPLKHLMPRGRYSTVVWYVEFAREGEAPPPVDLVLNARGDPDVAGPLPAVARRHLQTLGQPLLNAPERVSRTGRHQIAELLAGVPDLVVPWVARLAPRPRRPEDWRKRLWDQGLSLPALIRPTGSHGGKGLGLARDPLDLLSAVDEIEGEAYVTAFHDFVSSDGFYRKYRMIFIDRQPMAYHLAISPHWLVHHESSGMETDPVRQAEELRFLADPPAALGPKAMAAIAEIGRRIDLDYCGVDFSLLADGRVLLFEANATMLVHPEAPDSPFAAKTPYVEAIIAGFQAMLRRKAGLE